MCTLFSPICCAASVTLPALRCCFCLCFSFFFFSCCCCGCHSAAAAAVAVVAVAVAVAVLVALQKCGQIKTIEHIVHLHKHTTYVHTYIHIHIHKLTEHIVSACIHKCYTHTHKHMLNKVCIVHRNVHVQARTIIVCLTNFLLLLLLLLLAPLLSQLTSQCFLAQNNFRCVFLVLSLLFSLIVRNLMHLIFAFSH